MTESQSIEIQVPRVNPNEDQVTLVEWLVPSGSAVAAGDPICALESSKTVLEAEAPDDGHLHYLAEAGTELEVGAQLAVIAGPEPPSQLEQPAPATPAAGEPRLSAKARQLADELGVPDSAFAGMALVREADVRRLAGAAAGDPETDSQSLTPIQRRVAAAVSRSWREIPASSVDVCVPAQDLLDKARELGQQHRLLISPTALVIAAYARALKDFPRFNARLEDDLLHFGEAVNVNILMDAAGELVNPVVHAAEALDAADLARRLTDLQKRAATRKLAAEDFEGGTTTVTSLFGAGVHRLAPIVYPGQTAILGLADIDPSGAAPTVWLTLTFDHRAANALDAARLLSATIEKVQDL